MARQFHDDGFQTWEVFANTGEHGFPDDALLVFRCRTDPAQRPRSVAIEGDTTEAEARVLSLSDVELRALLGEALPLD